MTRRKSSGSSLCQHRCSTSGRWRRGRKQQEFRASLRMLEKHFAVLLCYHLRKREWEGGPVGASGAGTSPDLSEMVERAFFYVVVGAAGNAFGTDRKSLPKMHTFNADAIAVALQDRQRSFSSVGEKPGRCAAESLRRRVSRHSGLQEKRKKKPVGRGNSPTGCFFEAEKMRQRCFSTL